MVYFCFNEELEIRTPFGPNGHQCTAIYLWQVHLKKPQPFIIPSTVKKQMTEYDQTQTMIYAELLVMAFV